MKLHFTNISAFTKILSVTAFAMMIAICFGSVSKAMDFPHVSNVTKGIMQFQNPVPDDLLLVNGDDVAKGAENFIQNMGDRALGFLSNKDYDTKRKTREFKKLLEDSFDMKTIARFAMGRHYRTATKEQKKEYFNLFEKMIVGVYTARFDEYSGEKFRVGKARADGDRDVIVSSFITSANGPEIQVDWRVRYKNKQYQIVDVIVEGVSMSVTQRSEFSAIIQRGGGKVEVLLDHMRSRS